MEEFGAEQFQSVIGIDRAAWQQEMTLHGELFQQLAYHLPQELKATMDQEVVRYRAIVARANIRIEP